MGTISFTVGLVKPSTNRYGVRAPKGGATVNGRTFKGGQFCYPFDPANPHGVQVKAAPVVTRPVAAVEAPVPAPVKLPIAGFVYTVSEIPAGECGTVAFRLHKIDTNNNYDVIRNHFGEVTCDCPDYECRRVNTGTMCKHGKACVDHGLIPAPAARRPEPQWDGKALFAYARDHGQIGIFSGTARMLGFTGYLRMLSASSATEVYNAVSRVAAEVAAEF